MAFTSLDFRRTMAHFATGVNVVTTVAEGKYYGITVNAFCSVSLNPPLVLICIEKSAQSHNVIHKSGVYAVNMLCREQQELSERFATRDAEGKKVFHDIKLKTGETGAPLFEESLAYMECRVVAEYDGGDHTIFLGEVLDLHFPESEQPGAGESSPLLYYHSRYRTLTE